MSAEEYERGLVEFEPLKQPVMQAAIEELGPAPGSRGLDVGCGIGLQAMALAEAVGPGGRVTGLDVTAPFLVRAQEMAQGAGLADRLCFVAGSMHALPFPDGAFDWLWSADCAGYAPGDPLPLVRELARVVRPGGKVALLAWSSQQLLPGYPPLEARLNATPAGIAPFARGTPPAHHFLRAIGWFGEAGLEHARVRTFVRDVQAPLSPTIRQALLSLFDMRWGTGERDLSAEDRDLYRRLCDPESPELILDRPDYVAFFTYTMFTGIIP